MLTNYLVTAIRHLFKHKVYTLINISGLATGIASCLLAFLYVYSESRYDVFHQHADNIYRIYEKMKSPQGSVSYYAKTSNPLGNALKSHNPGLAVARLYEKEGWLSRNGSAFKEKVLFIDPEFFDLFTFPLDRGNFRSPLPNVNSLLISEKMAEKYFGDSDPIGQVLTIDSHYDLTVTGVLQPVPENSSIRFDFLAPFAALVKVNPEIREEIQEAWGSSGTYAFVRCSDTFTVRELQAELDRIKEIYMPEFLKERIEFLVQPLTSVHLTPGINGEMVEGNTTLTLYTVLVIALSILLIACFNYMNLSTALYEERSKEIGLRKVFGAYRPQLILQFLGETAFLSFVSLAVGIVLVELILPGFNAVLGTHLLLVDSLDPAKVAAVVALGLLITLCAGMYPAFILSSFQPMSAFKQRQKAQRNRFTLRQVLIFIQFAIVITLLICESVIITQVDFMQAKNLGFTPDRVVVVPTTSTSRADSAKIANYAHALHVNGSRVGIQSVSVSEDVPGLSFRNSFGIVPEGWDDVEQQVMVVTAIDNNFLDQYEIGIVEGRNFSPSFATDTKRSVLLNEAAVREIGWSSAVGKSIRYVHDHEDLSVVGVVKNSHFRSLHNEIEPLVYRFAADVYRTNYISVKISGKNIPTALLFMERQWSDVLGDTPFEYLFLSDALRANYEVDEKTAWIVGGFSCLAIILSVLGLLGSTALNVTQRTKEIGIRKALGASATQIVLLISRDYSWQVAIATLIAWPVAYYAMRDWLQGYAYRIHLGPGIFVFCEVVVVLITFLAIASQVLKVAMATTIKALRYE